MPRIGPTPGSFKPGNPYGGARDSFAYQYRHWGRRNVRAGCPYKNGEEYADWFTKYVIGHGKNRLPKDDPRRALGLTLDVPKVMDAIRRLGQLNKVEQRLWDSTMNRINLLQEKTDDC